MPAKTGSEQARRPGRFRPGQSGNPGGRPHGSRNRATIACETLLANQAKKLTQKAVELALAGDPTALKIVFDRFFPVRRDRAVTFALPPISTPHDAVDVAASVAAAVATGNLTPAEAVEIGKVIEIFIQAYRTAEQLDERAQVQQMTDSELLRVIKNASDANPAPPRLITMPVLRNGDP